MKQEEGQEGQCSSMFQLSLVLIVPILSFKLMGLNVVSFKLPKLVVVVVVVLLFIISFFFFPFLCYLFIYSFIYHNQ